uniref:Uncharacterized protein n=1 Tax=Tanacetum cinerariifolium TaxID=118510 RepID=A0A6L2JFK0_TANCI|nr:hypothetical protein [Tanacetum cinerariifolium]
MVKEEVKTQLLKILRKETSDFTTPLIQSIVAVSHENMVLTKSSLKPKSTYEATLSLIEFELKKVLFDKMNESESYRSTPEHKELYNSLSKSYNLDRDLFEIYGPTYSLKREREKKDKDEDPYTGSDRGSKHKLTVKSAHAEEPCHDLGEEQDKVFNIGNNDDEIGLEAVDKSNCFTKPDKPLTPDLEWKNCGSKRRSAVVHVQGRGFLDLNLWDIEDLLLLLTYCYSQTGRRSSTTSQKLQKKLNLTKPQTFKADIYVLTTYTAYNDPS